MYKMTDSTIKISVRELVEFILRSGDLDNRSGGGNDVDAMQEGIKIHRMLQKQMGSNYQAEVPLSIIVPYQKDGQEFQIKIEGRADGVLRQDAAAARSLLEMSENGTDNQVPSVVIDEIKSIYQDLSSLLTPYSVHRAQAMCYAYIYAKEHGLDCIGIQMTYCNIDTKAVKYFEETISYAELDVWFEELTREFGKWAAWQNEWMGIRTDSIRGVEFPFPYRPGQRQLVMDVYRTIIREKKLYIEAPTGVGKTISTVFPAVKAMGEGYLGKIFYLTAKTITRTVAEDTFHLLLRQGMRLKVITLTAKEKICVLERPDCNPVACDRAKGHFDRVNEAVYDLLTHEEGITRDLITEYAARHNVCPFEMSLDVSSWCDGIICDYNYAFDPNAHLRRFFSEEKKNDYGFLIDEAHNLVERARAMYSASLYKDHILECKRLIRSRSGKLERRLEAVNKDLLKLKRECDECEVVENINDVVLHLMGAAAEFEEFLQEYKVFDEREQVLNHYFEVRNFLNIFDLVDEKYTIYTDYEEKEGFRLNLQCMDPSTNLLRYLGKGKSAIFFSATLLPIQYYKDQLGGNAEDYAVYAPSPFDTDKRRILIAGDVSTRYTRRNATEYRKILDYIRIFTSARQGNYLVFFPSYQMMNQVFELMKKEEGEKSGEYILTDVKALSGYEVDGRMSSLLGDQERHVTALVMQRSSMTEQEKEEFLESFTVSKNRTRIGFCVMGGIFSEGIDLKEDRLIGAVIVGTGLPMVCTERELFKNYYDQRQENGFDYAYLYQGMNKVLQSAGRVIRTQEDRGAILLLDERFYQRQYTSLFPREWYPNLSVTRESLPGILQSFWNEYGKEEENDSI